MASEKQKNFTKISILDCQKWPKSFSSVCKVYLAKKMLEQKGREMLMKDNLIDLNFKSKGDQESEVINDLKNGKAIFLLNF